MGGPGSWWAHARCTTRWFQTSGYCARRAYGRCRRVWAAAGAHMRLPAQWLLRRTRGAPPGVGTSIFVVGAAKPHRPTSITAQSRCVNLVPISAHSYCRAQAHVGEYGVHWNFFHTIALVALAAAVVSPAPGRRLHLALGLMAAHQMVLSLGKLWHEPKRCHVPASPPTHKFIAPADPGSPSRTYL